MAKSYTLPSTYAAFGRVVMPEVFEFIEDSVEPDEIWEPEHLLDHLIQHHRDLLQEAVEDGRI
jgi:hypothetical protein